MTPDQMRAAIDYLAVCLRDIHESALTRSADEQALTDDEQTRWNEGSAEIERLKVLVARHDEIARLGNVPGAVVPAFHAPEVNSRTSESDLYSLDGVGFGDTRAVRDRALEVIERVSTGGTLDRHREQAEHLVRSMDPSLAARIVATSSPSYRSGFLKVTGGRPELLNTDERQAMERAVALGGTAGYAVPAMLDTTIIDTGAHSTNPFRQLATVKQITGSSWKGVSSAGVTAAWEAEGAESNDAAPTLAALDIPVFKGNVFVPFSLESEDWASMESDVSRMIQVAKDDLEGAAFVSGGGSSAPQGVMTGLDGTASEVAPTTAETFAKADVDKLIAALPARFRRNAAFVANYVWYNAIRAFETTTPAGSLLSTAPADIAGDFKLAGYTAYESSDMDSALPNAAATADNFGILFGDLAQGYYIVDRVGLNVELIPHLFHVDTNLPSGQRGFYAWFRTGAEVVNAAALRVLSIPTTA